MSSERTRWRHGGGHGCDVDTRADTVTAAELNTPVDTCRLSRIAIVARSNEIKKGLSDFMFVETEL